ncbi:YifB family Mg chelatase-like AAA ATPase [Candidatus Bipolaricaulota bacterium]|nr:YifB family Mg chelatase-like AAA ATPase [Candidatus Bipolaricaulota bacterium]
MFAKLTSGAVLGIDAVQIEVQCDVSGGLPVFNVVGLPEKEVSESRERIRSAIKNCGLSFPAGRITANLAPADLKKEGVGLDLPIAMAILAASGQMPLPDRQYCMLGELALNGDVCGVRGVLPISLGVGSDVDGMIVPADNAAEAAAGADVPVYPVATLAEARRFLCGEIDIAPYRIDRSTLLDRGSADVEHDLTVVRGQTLAKRAVEVAAAGGHNLLMIGPPGSGKSLLARCLPDLLPPLTFEEAIEVTRIYSSAGALEKGASIVKRRPFRAPHHTVSYAGMVGGGHGIPGPGEISLADHGVLFLDELPEFDRRVLETLRQPLEDRTILLSRAGCSVRYPAAFTLVAAMNPCPCGYLGDLLRPCVCSLYDVRRYRKRLSGPFLDRIDMFVEVPRLTVEELFTRSAGEASAIVRERVAVARATQWERLIAVPTCFSNAQLDGKLIDEHCRLSDEAGLLLRRAVSRFGLSARAHVRVLRIARTIADLEGCAELAAPHIAEAIQYRSCGEALGEH